MKSALDLFREIQKRTGNGSVRVGLPTPNQGPPSTDKDTKAPFEQLQVDWQAASARARKGFARHGVTPSTGTLAAATWVELLLADGWDSRWQWTDEDAMDALAAFYTGRRTARISEDGRVLLSTPAGRRPAGG